MKKFFLVILFLFCAAMLATSAWAASFTITANTNWSAISGGPPTSADDITVKNNAILTVDVANAVALTIQLGAGGGSAGNGTLAFNSGSQATFSGAVNVGNTNRSGTVDMTNGGTLITQSIANTATGSGVFTFTPGTGTLRITTTTTLPAALTSLYNFTLLDNGITVSLGADTTISNVLTLTVGTLSPSFYILTISGTGTPVVQTAGVFDSTGGTVRYTGNGAKVVRGNYYNLECKPNGSTPQILGTAASQTFTVNGNLTIGDGTAGHAGATGANYNPGVTVYGTVTVSANATLTTGGSGYILYGGGTPLVIDGTLSATNTITFFSNSIHLVPGSYNNVTLVGTGDVLDAGTFNIAGQIAFNGQSPDTSSNPVMNVGTININSGVTYTTGTGTLTFTGTGSTHISGAGTFNLSAGCKIAYTGNGATIKPMTYNALDIKPSGSTPIDLGNGATTVNGDLTIGDGANAGAVGTTYNSTLDLAGNLVVSNNATFTAGTGAVTMSGTGKAISGTASIPSLTINGTTTNNGTLTVATALGGSSTLTQGSGATLNIGGTSTIAGLNASTNSNTVVYNGTSADQTVKNVTYRNLTIDKGSYKANLGANLTVNDTLTFTSGNISTGANKVIIPSGGSISRTSGHVAGNLQMYIPTGATSKTLVIGDTTNYTPVDVSFGNVSVAGNLTGYTTASDHPDIANSGINSAKSVNRYWSMTKDGTLAFDNYSATLTFVAGDIDGGADYNNFIVAKNTSGAWSQPTVGTRTSTSTQSTGITSFSDFQLGEAGGGGGGGEPVKFQSGGGNAVYQGTFVVQ